MDPLLSIVTKIKLTYWVYSFSVVPQIVDVPEFFSCSRSFNLSLFQMYRYLTCMERVGPEKPFRISFSMCKRYGETLVFTGMANWFLQCSDFSCTHVSLTRLVCYMLLLTVMHQYSFNSFIILVDISLMQGQQHQRPRLVYYWAGIVRTLNKHASSSRSNASGGTTGASSYISYACLRFTS